MASTYSSLKIQLMGTGENSGTWGTITNTNLGTALEEAIVGSADVNFSSADVTLTLTDTNSSQSARNLRLNLTGSVGAPQNLIVPAIEKIYIINNGLTQTITVRNATGTGISVPPGKTEYVYNNGTNVVEAINHLTSLTLDTPLPISSGGTGTNSTTYVNLQSNVTGTLPNANTTAASANGASTIVARDASGNFAGATITATTFSGSGASLTSIPNSATTAASANGANTIVARDASGNFAGATITATTFSGSGASLTSLNASSISSGTVGTARLASGTANSTTFLRGDQTWAPAGSTVNVQIFTSSGTWTKPSSGTMCSILAMGGGGGGGRGAGDSNNVGGAGGASPTFGLFNLSDIPGTVTVTIGGGGNANNSSNASGGVGGATTFGSFIKAFGGNGGSAFNGNVFYPGLSPTDNTVFGGNTLGGAGFAAKSRNNATQIAVLDAVTYGAGGGGGGAGAPANAGSETIFGIGGNGSQNGGGSSGSGFGAGGGGGANSGANGTPGFCRITVW